METSLVQKRGLFGSRPGVGGEDSFAKSLGVSASAAFPLPSLTLAWPRHHGGLVAAAPARHHVAPLRLGPTVAHGALRGLRQLAPGHAGPRPQGRRAVRHWRGVLGHPRH